MLIRSGVWHQLDVAALYTLLCTCLLEYETELKCGAFVTCYESWRIHACVYRSDNSANELAVPSLMSLSDDRAIIWVSGSRKVT